MKYKIQKNGDVLNVEFGNTKESIATLTQVTAEKIDKMKSDQKLIAGSLIKIYGDIPNTVTAVIAHKLSHMFGVVAVYNQVDDNYIVTAVHDPSKLSVGDVLNE